MVSRSCTPLSTKRPENVSANNRAFCEKRHGKCYVSFLLLFHTLVHFAFSNGHRLPRVLRFYHPVCSETPAIRLATHSSRNQRPSILYQFQPAEKSRFLSFISISQITLCSHRRCHRKSYQNPPYTRDPQHRDFRLCIPAAYGSYRPDRHE